LARCQKQVKIRALEGEGAFSHPVEGETAYEVNGSERSLSAYGNKQRLFPLCRQEIGQGPPCTCTVRKSRGQCRTLHSSLMSTSMRWGKGASQTCSIGHKHESHYVYGVAPTNLAPWFSGSGVLGLRLAPLEAAGAASRAVESDVKRELVAL
jgi:hypothetical protein